jgi:hypothetical protein
VAFHRLPDHLRPLRCVDLGAVKEDDRHPPSRLGTRDEVIELVDEGLGGAAGREAPGALAVAPIDGSEAHRLAADPRRPHQPLAARPFRDQTRVRVG